MRFALVLGALPAILFLGSCAREAGIGENPSRDGAFVAGLEARAASLGDLVALRAVPRGVRSVAIRSRVEDAEDLDLAVLYLPERLADARGDLLLHGNALDAIPSSGDWSRSGQGLEYTAGSLQEIARFAPYRGARPLYEKPRAMRDPVRLRVTIQPRPSSLNFRLEVTNEGSRELHGVEASICLRFSAAPLIDRTGSRTFLVFDSGRRGAATFLAPAGIPRHRWILPAPAGMPQPPPAGERFWGPPHRLNSAPTAIVRRDEAPREVWLGATEARAWQTNLSREINCIHANPFFASILPGATAACEGRILMVARQPPP